MSCGWNLLFEMRFRRLSFLLTHLRATCLALPRIVQVALAVPSALSVHMVTLEKHVEETICRAFELNRSKESLKERNHSNPAETSVEIAVRATPVLPEEQIGLNSWRKIYQFIEQNPNAAAIVLGAAVFLAKESISFLRRS